MTISFTEGKTLSNTNWCCMKNDVAEGKMTLEEFVAQMTVEELAHVVGGQPNVGVANTFGLGNMPEYGIPSVMTADGPAGLRIQPECGVNTTAWPCATLLACTWDEELIYQVGEAGAKEVKENNSGVWLTPAINIHRNPLLHWLRAKRSGTQATISKYTVRETSTQTLLFVLCICKYLYIIIICLYTLQM